VDFYLGWHAPLATRREFSGAAKADSIVAPVSPAIRSTRTVDGHVLLDIEGGRMFCLNPVASRIFDLLQQGLLEDRIVAQIVADYAVAFRTAEVDVHEFLESLARHHILDDRQASRQGEKRGNL
jgi:hypothetical protein